ncbi:MAG: hypothetical protein WCR46_02135 [Deltaproteobacteria bacterium]
MTSNTSFNINQNCNDQNEPIKIYYNHEVLENPAIDMQYLCELKSDMTILDNELDNGYRVFGELQDAYIYGDCYNSINQEKILSKISGIQTQFDITASICEAAENNIIRVQLVKEENDFNQGPEYPNAGLIVSVLFDGMDDLEYQEKLAIAKRRFENYEGIRQLRIDKLNNLISWEEMENKINNILHIGYNL